DSTGTGPSLRAIGGAKFGAANIGFVRHAGAVAAITASAEPDAILPFGASPRRAVALFISLQDAIAANRLGILAILGAIVGVLALIAIAITAVEAGITLLAAY